MLRYVGCDEFLEVLAILLVECVCRELVNVVFWVEVDLLVGTAE